MEIRARNCEDEFAIRTQQPPDLAEDRVELLDVFEHRVGQDPVKRSVRLGHAVAADGVHDRVDPELFSLRSLCGVGIDANDLARAGLFENDPRQQSVAASEIQAAPLGQSRSDQMARLDRTPMRCRRLKRIVMQKADQKVAPQGSNPSSSSS